MNKKTIIYSVLPRLFDNRNQKRKPNGSLSENGCGKMNHFTPKALEAIRSLGTTHIWYVGLLEHATQTDFSHFGIEGSHIDIIKGKAGSPYSIKDYYDISPELAIDIPNRMKEFEDLVKRTHNAGMGVIIDFVPNHVAREYHSDNKPKEVIDFGMDDDTESSFLPDNNFYYLPEEELHLHLNTEDKTNYSEKPARATGNDLFSSHVGKQDWYETVKLNYGIDYLHEHRQYFTPIPRTWIQMKDILLYWAEKGVDGFRCDMAEMVPVEFWEWVIPQIKQKHSVLFIAEIYQPQIYTNYINAGFNYLYDKVGMYDTLRAITIGQGSASDISGALMQTEGLTDHMLYFLENHDEQRIASKFFADDPRKAIPAVTIATTIGRNPFMLYFAQELGEKGMDAEGFSGQDGRTSIFDYWSLDKMQRRINEGKYDNALLSTDERILLHSYTRLLKDICSQPIINEGKYYGLNYANKKNPHFDSDKIYAFFRYTAKEILLVTVNFAPTEANIRINIPEHSFSTMGIRENTAYRTQELLTGTESISCLTQYAPYPIHMTGYGSSILLFTRI